MQESGQKSSTQEKLSKKVWIAILTTTVIIATLAVGIGIYSSPANRLSRQLNLGQKYLLEQNYEQAILEFDKAIAIDPMNADAYLGKAEAYVKSGDYESAITTLEEGYQATAADKVIKSINNYISQYLDILLEEARYEEIRALAAKYRDIATGVDFDKYLNEIEELEAYQEAEDMKQELLEMEEEIRRLVVLCGTPYLKEEGRKERLQPVAELLEKYREVWEEDDQLIYSCGGFLSNYYYFLGELENCLEVRKVVYEKTGAEGYNPSGHVMSMSSNLKGNYCWRYDEYGKHVEEILDSDVIGTWTWENGRMIAITGSNVMEYDDSSYIKTAEFEEVYQYDDFGRKSKDISHWKAIVANHEPISSDSTTTYTYTENGCTAYVYDVEYFGDGSAHVSETYIDYVIDEYGAETEISRTEKRE